MPNHVTHRITLRGPGEALSAFRARCIRIPEGGDSETLDFETLIPMPASLRSTESGSSVRWGLIVLGRSVPNGFGDRSPTAADMLGFPWVKEAGVTDVEGLKALLVKQDPGCVEKAEAALRAYDETGFTDWYGWSLAKWGTKWNAYEFQIVSEEPGEIEFTFDTAWSVPKPILKAIAREFPAITGTVAAFDEGWNYAFVGAIAGGHFLGASQEATDELYERVYGYAPDRSDDDEEEPSAAEIIAAEEAGSRPAN